MRIWLLLLICSSEIARSATHTAASVAFNDVIAALALATAGDTVQIPAGSNRWTSGTNWSAPANVTLKGAGTTATGGGDQTVIVDDYASGNPILNMDLAATGTFRFSGITVQTGTGDTKNSGIISFSGETSGSVTARIDHCRFIGSNTPPCKTIAFNSGVFGVMDHCIVDLTGINSLYFYNGRNGGVNDVVGNFEWSQETDFGGGTYFFVEDNIINGDVPSGTYSTRTWDGYSAAKVVVRFNTVSQAGLSEVHPTGHAGNDRGSRSQEIYGNAVTSTLTYDPNFVAVDLSSGTALVWGNTWDQVYKSIYRWNVTRKNADAYTQTATPDGWGYAGTAFNGVGSSWDGGTALGTDTVTGYPALDQPGRGRGAILTNDHPNKINFSTGTLYWPTQALEPMYLWNNSGGIVSGWGGALVSDATSGRVITNRDAYLPASGIQTSPTSPFDGTIGVGWGTLANRPTTCTAGVAYFATDQGDWNTSASNPYGVQQNGADGVLYVATATDTWTLYYTPYTYPHPLNVSEASLSPGRRKPRVGKNTVIIPGSPWFPMWASEDLSDFTFQLSSIK